MKPRTAIAGAGLMGFWHAKAIERSGGTVATVFDCDAGAAQRLAARFRGARASTSLAEGLAQDRIDVLHLCTPSESHFELAAAALRQGIHVLAEKPLTPTAIETERLYVIAAENGALLCPVHQFPFQRGVQNAARALGRIGRLRHFEARFCSAGGHGRGAAGMDAVIADILPHPLSLIPVFAPGSLRETGWNLSRPAPGELRATQTVDEVCFSILVSMNSRPTSASLLLLGTEGTIHLDLFHGFSVIEPGDVSRWRKIVHPFALAAQMLLAAGTNLARRIWTAEPAYPGLRPLVQSFYGAIEAGSAPPISGDETVAIARTRGFFIGH